jgi:hypothetical protein
MHGILVERDRLTLICSTESRDIPFVAPHLHLTNPDEARRKRQRSPQLEQRAGGENGSVSHGSVFITVFPGTPTAQTGQPPVIAELSADAISPRANCTTRKL